MIFVFTAATHDISSASRRRRIQQASARDLIGGARICKIRNGTPRIVPLPPCCAVAVGAPAQTPSNGRIFFNNPGASAGTTL
jgi:hypothetical protein